MSDYDRLVAEARGRLVATGRPAGDVDVEAGPEVQLSVRLPRGLRTAVTEVARRRGQTLTQFVTDMLRKTVTAEIDPFAGLATTLTDEVRRELAAAVADGSYTDWARRAEEIEAAWQ